MMRLGRFIILSLVLSILTIAQAAAQYCESSAQNGDYEYISEVTIADTTIASGSDLYADNTDLIVNMYQNEDYSLEFVNATHDAPDQVACWIDWDQNHTFEENERLNLTYNGSAGEASPATGTIIPPDTAQTGVTRMRIMLASEDPAPCLSFAYGEVEDYAINVMEITSAPELDVQASQTEIYTDEVVEFTDLTFLNPQSWQWNFSPATVTFLEGTDQNSQHPVVRFEEAADYDVSLTATNSIGASDTTFEDYISVQAFHPPRNISTSTEGTHVNLSWDKPNMPGYFEYEIMDNADALVGATPERATFFDQEDFDYNYPVTIEKIRTSFYEDYEGNPWSDASFKMKIYASDGNTLLYESPEMEALSYQYITHELEEPLTLEQDFYLAVAPVDTTGAPQSLSRVVHPEATHSFFLYDGEWTPLTNGTSGFELASGIYIAGSKNSGKVISYENQIETEPAKSQLEDFDLEGYQIYRNSTLVKEIGTADSTYWIDEQLANGEYEYYLKAIYAPQGVSIPSDTSIITVDNTEPEIKLLSDKGQLLLDDTYKLDTNVMLNEHADMQFAIYNEGMNNLEIGEISIDHPSYSVVEVPETQLAGQDTTTFTIRFQPSSDSISLKKAHVSFETNDSNEDPFEFSVEAIAGQDKWTWMVYLLEDGTGLNGAKDINEWEVNGSVPGRANYLVLYDSQDDAKDGIYYVTKDPQGMNSNIQSPKVSKVFGTDPEMSDEQTLEEFLMWTKENYPAQHYGLTMWDHGSGIFKQNDQPGGVTKGFVGGMKLWEMSDAVEAFKNTTGQNINVIGFDVCLLGQFETAYQFRNTADYVIASELTEPGDGWDYTAGFDSLTVNPDIAPETVAKVITDTYIESYGPGGSQGNTYSTQAATSNKIMTEEFIPVFDSLANKLSYYLYDLKPVIADARNQAYASPNVQGGGEKNPNHRDLGHFLDILIDNLDYPEDLVHYAERALEVYNEMIVANGYTGEINKNATGVKIWMPKKISSESYVKDYYLNPDVYLNISYTRWDEYLQMYEEPSYSSKPEVNFTVPDTVEKGQIITPENRTFFADQKYSWGFSTENVEFVNGTDETSKQPKFRLTETATYSISLSAENEYGNDDTTKTNVVTVVEPEFTAPESLTADKYKTQVNLSWQAEVEGAIFTEGFETVQSFPPEGWSLKSNDNLEGTNLTEVADDANTWGLCDSTSFNDQSGNPDPQYIHSGSYSAAIAYTAGQDGDPFNWLITPEIELRENDMLSFWLWYASDDSYYTDFDVMLYADGTWTSLLHLTQGSGTNLYDERIECSLADYANKKVKIAFVYQYTDGYQLAIDDIMINNAEKKAAKSAQSNSYPTNLSKAKTNSFLKSLENQPSGQRGKADGAAYKIYRNDTLIAQVSDLNTMSYTDTLSENGEYEYYVTKTYTNPTGESEPSNKVTIVMDYIQDETGINESFTSKIAIYPNPSDGQFVVDFGRSVDYAHLALFNQNGEQVYRSICRNANQKSIQLLNIASGVYYLEIQVNNDKVTKKIIIR